MLTISLGGLLPRLYLIFHLATVHFMLENLIRIYFSLKDHHIRSLLFLYITKQ